jgi:PemK-like, MazF-like toxin of type II toxin-antitoxin system
MISPTLVVLSGAMAADDTPLWAWPMWLILWGGLAWLLVRRWRGRRPRPAVHAEPPDPSWFTRPAPGQIWWAEVPFADGTGSKVRPCLVVRTHADYTEVLKITSQDKSHRWDHVPIPTEGWDRNAWKESWVDLSGTYALADSAFRRHAASSCDGWTWAQVTRRHATGWVYTAEQAGR